MTEVSACSRTTGLALKAMPSPAASSMSRSLAPSPIAMVRESAIPSSRANRRSASALAARSTTAPSTRPVRTPSRTSSRFASTCSMPSRSASGRTISMNPPETSPTVNPRRLRVRTSVRAPGVRRTCARTWSSTDAGRPASSATRSCRLSAKSSSPRMARSVTAVTSASRPAWTAISSMTSSWIRVESTSMTTRRRPRRARPAGDTATSTPKAAATADRTRRRPLTSAPDTSISIVVTGQREIRRMRSMLPPCSAIASAMADMASAVMGEPSTVTCSRPLRRPALSPKPVRHLTFMPSASPARVRSAATPAGSSPTDSSTARVRCERTTTCSTSNTVRSRPATAAKSTALTPGRSGPVSVTRSVGPWVGGAGISVTPPRPDQAFLASRNCSQSCTGARS